MHNPLLNKNPLRKQIRAARARRGWSQAKLARKLGLTAQSVTNWEREGGASPLKKRIEALEQVLGCEFQVSGDIPRYLDDSEAKVVPIDAPEGLVSTESLVKRIFRLTHRQRVLVARVLDAME